MMVVFVLQVAVTIYSFTLMNQTQVMVTNELKRLILDYSYGYQIDADWIQSKVSFSLNRNLKKQTQQT